MSLEDYKDGSYTASIDGESHEPKTKVGVPTIVIGADASGDEEAIVNSIKGIQTPITIDEERGFKIEKIEKESGAFHLYITFSINTADEMQARKKVWHWIHDDYNLCSILSRHVFNSDVELHNRDFYYSYGTGRNAHLDIVGQE